MSNRRLDHPRATAKETAAGHPGSGSAATAKGRVDQRPERSSANKPSYPGKPAIVDGSEAIASVEVRISEGACAYPITPSTNMAAAYQAAVANGARNLWGTPLRFLELESEHSSASAAEGFALAGHRVTNFTAGQGLILMKEVLYVIAGKRLPAVFHVGARALTSQSLNIHAGHDDVYGVADTGWGILFARNAQEAADFTAIARRVAEETFTPFFVVQDGFLTTHTIESLRLPEDELLRTFVGDPRARLHSLFEPGSGPGQSLMSGVVQNQDAYMPGRIGQRAYTERIPAALDAAFADWAGLTGRQYAGVSPYRITDEGGAAERVVVAAGTLAETSAATVDALRARGERVGSLTVSVYRPFPAAAIAAALGGAAIAVIERTDEPLAAGGPLTREIAAALYAAHLPDPPQIRGVAAGLGSRDVAPGDIAAVFAWLAREPEAAQVSPGTPAFAVLGVRHRLALPRLPIVARARGAYCLRGHSIGGFGSVTTNKLLATTLGDLFERPVQAFPRYGSEKKGLPTAYFLTIADEHIRTHAELEVVDFVPLHGLAAFAQGSVLAGLRDGGIVFVSCELTDPAAIAAAVPAAARAEMVARGISLYALDTAALGREYAPRPDLLVRMQGVALVGAFLAVSPLAQQAGYDRGRLLAAVKGQLVRFFGKRGPAVVAANLAVVTAAYDGVIDVTAALAAISAAASEPSGPGPTPAGAPS